MNSADFLDQIRQQMDLPSDNQVAKLLGMPRERISMYRTGKREFDQDTCVAVAELLGEPPEFVLASIEAERAKSKNLKRVWASIANMAKKGQAAGLVSLAIIGMSNFAPQNAEANQELNGSENLATVYTLCAYNNTGLPNRSSIA